MEQYIIKGGNPLVGEVEIGGAKNAVNYLKEKKHRKIAHICGNPNKKVTIERFNGYIQAMQEADLEVKDGYIQYS